MMTMRDVLMTSASCSPDGLHWEPALPLPMFGWRYLWRDAWEVLNGRAIAVRNTTKADLLSSGGTPEAEKGS